MDDALAVGDDEDDHRAAGSAHRSWRSSLALFTTEGACRGNVAGVRRCAPRSAERCPVANSPRKMICYGKPRSPRVVRCCTVVALFVDATGRF